MNNKISTDPSELNDLMYKPVGTKLAFNVDDIGYHQKKAWLYASRTGAKIKCTRGFLIIDSECTPLSVVTVLKSGNIVKTRGKHKDSSVALLQARIAPTKPEEKPLEPTPTEPLPKTTPVRTAKKSKKKTSGL